MTYRAGVSGALAAWFPEHDSEPQLCCDAQACGTRMAVRPTRGGAPAWLRNRKAPKGWKRIDRGDLPAQHLCPRCVASLRPGGYLG